MERGMSRIGSVPDMERLRETVLPELKEGFATNPELTFAIVGQSGSVYVFGTEQDRAKAEAFCVSGDPRDEPLFIFGRPVTNEDPSVKPKPKDPLGPGDRVDDILGPERTAQLEEELAKLFAGRQSARFRHFRKSRRR